MKGKQEIPALPIEYFAAINLKKQLILKKILTFLQFF